MSNPVPPTPSLRRSQTSANPIGNGNGNGRTRLSASSNLPPPTPIRRHKSDSAFTTPPSQTSQTSTPDHHFNTTTTFAVPSLPASRSITPAPAPVPPVPPYSASLAIATPFMPAKPLQHPSTMPIPHSSAFPSHSTTIPVALAASGPASAHARHQTASSATLPSSNGDRFTTPASTSIVARPHWNTTGLISKRDRKAFHKQPPPTPARPMMSLSQLQLAAYASAPTALTDSPSSDRMHTRASSSSGAKSSGRVPLSESRSANGSGFGGSGFGRQGVTATPTQFSDPRVPPSTVAHPSSSSIFATTEPAPGARRPSSGSLFVSPSAVPILPNLLTRDYFLRAAARCAHSNSKLPIAPHAAATPLASSANSAENANPLPFDDSPPPASTSLPSRSLPVYLNDHFRINHTLGLGSFSKVQHVTRLSDHGSFALKSLTHHYRGSLDRRRALEEVWVWHLLAPHPRLVALECAWEQLGTLYMCMEVCPGGTLADYLEARAKRVGHPLAEPDVWGLLADIGQGLEWMHARGVAHLDVKPANVYLTARGGCKLGDFGLATFVGWGDLNPQCDEDEVKAMVSQAGGVWDECVHGVAGAEALAFDTARSLDDRHGDAMYAPPESVQGVFTTKTDVFAFGLVALEMVTDAMMPTEGPEFEDLRRGSFAMFEPRIPVNTSRELRELIGVCLLTMVRFRPTMHAIMGMEEMLRAKERRWKEVWSLEGQAQLDGGAEGRREEDVDMGESADTSLTPTPTNPNPNQAWGQITTPTMAPGSLLHTPRKPSTEDLFAPPPSSIRPPFSTSAFGNTTGNPFATPSAPPPQTPSRGVLPRAPKRAMSRSSSISSSGSSSVTRPAKHPKPLSFTFEPDEMVSKAFGAGGSQAQLQRPNVPSFSSRATAGAFSTSSQPLPPIAHGDGYMWPRLPHHQQQKQQSQQQQQQPLSRSASFSGSFSSLDSQSLSSPGFGANGHTHGAPLTVATTALPTSSVSSSPLAMDDNSPLAARVSTRPRPTGQPPARLSFEPNVSAQPPATPNMALGHPCAQPTPDQPTPAPATAAAPQSSYFTAPEPHDSPMPDVDMYDDPEYPDASDDVHDDLSSQGGTYSYGGDDDIYDEDGPAHMQSPLRGARSRALSHPVPFRPVGFQGFGGMLQQQQPPPVRENDNQVSQGPSPPLTAPDEHGLADVDSMMEDTPSSDPGDFQRQAAEAADQRRRASLSVIGSRR